MSGEEMRLLGCVGRALHCNFRAGDALAWSLEDDSLVSVCVAGLDAS